MRHFAAWCAVLMLLGCGGPEDEAKRGEACYRDDDCAYGLVCAPPAEGGDRVCTDDVSALVSVVAPPVAPAAGAANSPDAGTAGAVVAP